jgi:hypothetical protein
VIKYRLQCARGHEFEGWFPSIASYEAQIGASEISCPDCGRHDVGKAIMAPNVAARHREADSVCRAPAPTPEFMDFLREARRALVAALENVGPEFAEEARKIHYGETEPRGIWGKATREQARELLDEGIAVFSFPTIPEDAN